MNSLVIYPAFLDFQEVVIIMVVAVVIFGPDKIPEIARGLGTAVRKLKEASEDIKQEIMNPIQESDVTKDLQNTIKELNPMDQVKNSFQKINPMDDFQKSFDDVRNPIDEIHSAVHQDNLVDDALRTEPVKTETPIQEEPIQIEEVTVTESAVEPQTEQLTVEPQEEIKEPTVNNALGGSVSR
ncbi:twin-arginine translocase TatA/TatE family subunit [Algoriella xinjiangensis]|nr:twin-arginine translocase TatA/TatE family subunit [Algoriella xinjiangensis]